MYSMAGYEVDWAPDACMYGFDGNAGGVLWRDVVPSDGVRGSRGWWQGSVASAELMWILEMTELHGVSSVSTDWYSCAAVW